MVRDTAFRQNVGPLMNPSRVLLPHFYFLGHLTLLKNCCILNFVILENSKRENGGEGECWLSIVRELVGIINILQL